MMPRLCLAALLLVATTGCAAFGHTHEADSLQAELSDLPGLASVDVQYGEPAPLDADSVIVHAKAADDAPPDQLLALVEHSYAAFTGPLEGSNYELQLNDGDDRLSLGGFDAAVPADALSDAAAAALGVMRSEATADVAVHVSIDTEARKRPITRIAVDQPGGAEQVLATLDRLERAHADVTAFWQVGNTEGTGWGLGSSAPGFPTAAERARWAALRRDLPAGGTVLLVGDIASVQLADDTPASDVVAIATRHLELLGGVAQAAYDVSAGTALASVVDGECSFTTDPVGRAVERALGDQCTDVTHPVDDAGE